MRNGPERISCLCRVMKLRRKEQSVGVVRRKVVVKGERRKRKAGTSGAHCSGGGERAQGPRWDAPFKQRRGNR